MARDLDIEFAEPAGLGGLPEADRLGWKRERASDETLTRAGRHWTVWTAWVVGLFAAPGVVLLAIEPLTFPVALLCFAHALGVPMMQARRGARSVVAIGSERSAASVGVPSGPEEVALGLLADLVGRRDLELLRASGLAMFRGNFGTWLVGEQGAFLVRPPGRFGGNRVFCWCVRVGDMEGLPAADRVAHLLLALREDEVGFATIANKGFSGAAWRVWLHLGHREREALVAAEESWR